MLYSRKVCVGSISSSKVMSRIPNAYYDVTWTTDLPLSRMIYRIAADCSMFSINTRLSMVLLQLYVALDFS